MPVEMRSPVSCRAINVSDLVAGRGNGTMGRRRVAASGRRASERRGRKGRVRRDVRWREIADDPAETCFGRLFDAVFRGWGFSERERVRPGRGHCRQGRANATPLGSKNAMVRIRKNAASLTAAERDRYLTALGQLNARGGGPYKNLRDMHVIAAYDEEHGDVQFLPWHRGYVLDFERELQAIDPSVTVPYWRFDQVAPSLFSAAFLGVADRVTGRLSFTPGHPLTFWRTDGRTGIVRAGRASTPRLPFLPICRARRGRSHLAPPVDMGTSPPWRAIRTAPPTSGFTTNSPITDIPAAPRDPIFFSLHANVDRLWAKWQWAKGRFDPEEPNSFAQANTPRIGRALGDTMWPWNRDRNPPRPNLPPLTAGMPNSSSTPAPGNTPSLAEMFDYRGTTGGASLGFDYDAFPSRRTRLRSGE